VSRVVVAFHSGYGHTRSVAQAVKEGAASVPGVSAELLDVTQTAESGWAALAAADAIVFGSPTYMGGVSADFKKFADESAKVWFTQGWKNKIAGGFTCSLNMSGDKYSSLMYFVTLAMQHGMVWAGLNIMGNETINRLGSSIGMMAHAGNTTPADAMHQGDLDTALAYGARVAQVAAKLRA
jgi:NAD(P)H dehydrogenase (quinone)